MRSILLITLLFFSYPAISKDRSYFRNQYCIVNDNYNEMGLWFETKGDTVFVYYLNVIDNGNYINGGVDEQEYAGRFLKKSMKNDTVTLKVKNYRNEEDTYMVTLHFADNGKKCSWNIYADGPVAYLPKNAVFTVCSKD